RQATRWELSKDCFQGHQNKSVLDSAIDELLSSNPPRIIVESIPRPKGTPGTPTKIYKLAAKSAKSANYEHPRGFAGDSANREVSEVIKGEKGLLRTPRTLREVQNRPQTRASIDTSLASHTSHANSKTDDDVEVI
ncbi:MAG: hypothetical protein JWR74_327, partial [Polaromonas sp.]|nr:hypothetical protein [Polaromonas sp.]